ncbi:MAG: hypothetical protein K0S65_2703, partial [Labilithrix sp.]|nr:hypothetical protein [Labilithrix sp.]
RLEEAVSGRTEGDVWSELATVGELLRQAYRAHLEEEESRVFPAARAILDADALEAMSREMDARRGRP